MESRGGRIGISGKVSKWPHATDHAKRRTFLSAISQLIVLLSSGSCRPLILTYSHIPITIPALVSSFVSSRSANWPLNLNRSGTSSRTSLITQVTFSSPFLSNSNPSNSAGPCAAAPGGAFGAGFRHSIALPSGWMSLLRSSSTEMDLKKWDNFFLGGLGRALMSRSLRPRSESGSSSAASSSVSSRRRPSMRTRKVGICPVSKSNGFSSRGQSEFCQG